MLRQVLVLCFSFSQVICEKRKKNKFKGPDAGAVSPRKKGQIRKEKKFRPHLLQGHKSEGKKCIELCCAKDKLGDKFQHT